MAIRLKNKYKDEIVQQLMTEFGYKNVNQVPKLEKVVLNMGLGEALQNPKVLDGAQADLAAITGQKPVVTKARKSIATFKLREGNSIGCRVTLRGNQMYEFLERLINIAGVQKDVTITNAVGDPRIHREALHHVVLKRGADIDDGCPTPFAIGIRQQPGESTVDAEIEVPVYSPSESCPSSRAEAQRAGGHGASEQLAGRRGECAGC